MNISNSESSQHNSVYNLFGEKILTASISYSTFINNTAEEYRTLYHQYGNIDINYSNILSNICSQSPSTDNGIIYAYINSIVTVEHCVLSNNKGYYLFCSKNAAKQMIIKSCYFPSNDIIETTYGPVTTSTVDSLQINNEHFNSAMCYAPNPINFITLQLIELDRRDYYYKTDRYIKVSGNGKSDGDSISIYYRIDNNDVYKLNDTTLSYQENDMTYSFTGFCEIPNAVNEPGTYNLAVYASNGIDLSETINNNFEFMRNTPKIEIIKQPKYPVYINKTRIMEFTLLVTDKDGEGNVTINHILHNLVGENPVNIQIINENGHLVPYNVSIPENFDVGSYNVKFMAKDEHNLFSEINIQVIFTDKPTEFENDEINMKRYKNNIPPLYIILSLKK